MIDVCLRGLALLVVLVLLAGCRDRAAPVSRPAITVSLVLAGASAEELEATAVRPIEEVLGKVPGVHSLRTTIAEGHALVIVEVDPARLDTAIADVQRGVSNARTQLPEALDHPVISRVDPAAPAHWFAVSGPLPPVELADLARALIARRLERTPGVADVVLVGDVERVVVIRPDLTRLAAYGVTLTELAAAVRTANVARPATAGVAALSELVVSVREDVPIRLVDVATIEESLEGEAATSPMLGVRIQHGADRTALRAAVHAEIAELRTSLPPDVTLVESTAPAGFRPPAPVAVTLRGPSWSTVVELAGKLEGELRGSNLASEIVREPAVGRPESRISFDRDRLAELGIPMAEVATAIRIAAGGETVGTSSERGRVSDVVLRVEGGIEEVLAGVHVRAREGVLVPLSAVATATVAQTENVLRVDGERAVMLSLHLAPGQTATAARRRIRELTRGLPAGYRAIITP